MVKTLGVHLEIVASNDLDTSASEAKRECRNKKTRHLLVISFIAPGQGTGSGIVLLRHLQNLDAAGWRITICAPERELASAVDVSPGWRTIAIPPRVWWWPPFRDYVHASNICRAALIARKVAGALGRDLPTHILTVLWGVESYSAAMLARRIGRPLIAIVHDQQEFWAASPARRAYYVRRNQAVLSRADIVFGVSEEILNAYGVCRKKGEILLPAPGETIFFSPDHLVPPPELKVFHAGSLHPWQADNFLALASSLSARGGKLVLVTDAGNQVYRIVSERFPETERMPPPRENDLVVQAIAERASACLVSYALDRDVQPWGASSFPSKLIDFSRAGVPVLILAPEDSAIGHWCRKTGFDLFVSDLNADCLDPMVEALRDASRWRIAASRIRMLAATDFSALEIQRKLEAGLSRAEASVLWRSS
ncbi:hypothetical protein M2323_002152 [Rhodoblastus acidophilus]|uniref:glycosyltransferase n=1 Tax=Rhodoblastus acidophilus TaxID=1074 RepID=UPI0022252915|nr:glycosyltransferase [Rhodoblastus acidophilus]MCW2284299.1 hypothetical protein [Rhodoblastus acidophilus]MCW2333223.1 hypothetical protein [Rhodoblastus acidophilus]